jgi:hypothetical protein
MAIKFLNTVAVDTDVLYVDASNDRVGIGTTSPETNLQIGEGTGTQRILLYGANSLSTSSEIILADSSSGPAVYRFGAGIRFDSSNNILSLRSFFNGNNTQDVSLIDLYRNTATENTPIRINYDTSFSGNVGIGTTSPSAKLEVNGQTVINSTGLTEGFQWFNDTNEIFSLEDTSGAGELLLLSSNSVKVKLNANGNSYFNGGNVGIGTTSPGQKLDVVGGFIRSISTGANLVQGAFVAQSSTTDSPGYRGQGYFTHNQELDVSWYMGTPYTNGDMFVINRQNTAPSFDTGAANMNGTNVDNFFAIKNNGNVGIGTSNPGVKLHIGPGTASSSTVEEFRIQTGTSSGYGGTAIINLLTGQYGNSGIYFGDQATYSSQPAFIEFQDSPSTLIYKAPVTSGSHVFKIGTSEQVRIAYNGYVGIGMSNPGAKLHVGVSSGSSSTTQEFRLQTQSGGYGGEAIINLRTGQYGTSGVYFGDGLSHTAQPAYIKFIDSSNSFGLKTTGSFSFQVNSSIGMYLNAVGLGVGTTSPGEKLEVNGSVKATASTDAYKGYIKQNVISYAAEKQENANYYFTSYNTTATVTSAQAYNRIVAAYSGRVKKVYIRHGGGLTPTATAVNFKKHTNGTTSSTIYSATVANSAGANMSAYYEFGNNDFTFSAGDLIGLLYQTTDAFGTASKTMGQVAVTITLEYNIT